MFKNCTFCTQGISVFCVGLVTDGLFPCINGLIFITETEYVGCAVGTESLNISAVNRVFKGLDSI